MSLADPRSAPERRARAARAGGASRREAARARAQGGGRGEAGADLYEQVTRRVIAELEEGRAPWVQPWGRADGPACGLPRNALSGRVYSGVNILILWGAVIERGYASQNWLTFGQTRGAGGQVRRGERGTTIVYASRFTPERERGQGDAPSAAPNGDDPQAPRAVAFLKRFTVFNVAQIDGLPERATRDPAPLPECALVPLAAEVIAASGVAFRIGGERAFYAPVEDFVQVPPQPAFFDPINYYRTCLHELTHATGHASRLGRDLESAFGSKDYAREELIAEMGSAFLCAALGIVPTVRHADYIGGWLDVLRDDLSGDPAVRGARSPRGCAIFRAASAASKAADWLLARHRTRAAEPASAEP